jgi:Tfp pilus assembly PilM family ATPase
MAKRCIGIDISSSYLRAVQIVRTGEEFRVERVFSAPIRRSTDVLPDTLESLTSQHGFDRRAEAAVSLPHGAVFFRHVETDFAGLEQVRQGDSSALQPNFPIEPEEIVTQVYSHRRLPDGEYSVLTAALNTESLRQRLSVLAEANMSLNLVEAPVFAVHSAIAVNHPEIATGTALIAHVDESYLTLAVTEDNGILIVRSIPIDAWSDNTVDSVQEKIAEVLWREAQITWRKTFGTDIEQDSRIYLVIGDNSYHHLGALVEQNTNCQVTIVDPHAELKSPPDCRVDGPLCVAEGLALRLLAPEKARGTDFLQAHHASRQSTFRPKREFAICAMLAVAIAVIWIVGLFLRLSYLETGYGHIKNEIREIFESTLPNENIVSPLVQLEQEFESFRRDYELFAPFYPTSLSAFDALYNISKNTPSLANAKVDDLLIGADVVRIKGTCDSFESVYEWERLLRKVPGFARVNVQDPQREPKSNRVNCTILLSSEARERE